jgi:biotin transport system substrate-specific component
VLIAAGVALLAIAAHVSFPVPGSAVPQTAQTLVVVLVGAALGARQGTVALCMYLLLGAVGLPVFADGTSGVSHLFGPTAGYLFGFVLSAGLVGRLRERARLNRFDRALLAGILAHLIILTLGGLWLARGIGFGPAFESGVQPFLWGGIVKSAVAAAVIVGTLRTRGRASALGRVSEGVAGETTDSQNSP